jgi:hypothetical protein
MARDGQKSRERGEEVTNDLPPVWEHENEGDELAGYYRGFRELTVRGHTFRTYLIEDEETGEISSFSGAIADRKMARVPQDTYIWITYMGSMKTAKGKAKDYKVTLPKGVDALPELLGGAV